MRTIYSSGHFGKPLRAGMLAILLLATWAATAQAVEITLVTFPNLTRPSDGKFYPFEITVSGTYDAADILAGAKPRAVPTVITVEYWDEDFFWGGDDAIDLKGSLKVPLPGAREAGAAWGPVKVTLQVGCTVDSKVFGPAGEDTGENPMNDGYFRFLLAKPKKFGFNTVTCDEDNPNGDNPVVPEPGTLVLLASGLAGFARLCQRRSLSRQA
jgi:PEP-CTERM motif-containing protein